MDGPFQALAETELRGGGLGPPQLVPDNCLCEGLWGGKKVEEPQHVGALSGALQCECPSQVCRSALVKHKTVFASTVEDSALEGFFLLALSSHSHF